jgi:hypothetical protein
MKKKRALTDRGSPLQDLLDEEAELSNTGQGDSEQRQHLLTIIRLKRSEFPQPHCFGEDDCSTLVLSRCPWRMDCGS